VEDLSREAKMRENDRDEMGLETEYATLDAGALLQASPPSRRR